MKAFFSILVFTLCHLSPFSASTASAMGVKQSKPATAEWVRSDVIHPSLELIGSSLIQNGTAYFSEMYPTATSTHVNLVSVSLDSRNERTSKITETCQFPNGTQEDLPVSIHSISWSNQKLVLYFTACWEKRGVMVVDPLTLSPVKKLYLSNLESIAVSGDSIFALSQVRQGPSSVMVNTLKVLGPGLETRETHSFTTQTSVTDFQANEGRVYYSQEAIHLGTQTVAQFYEYELRAEKQNLLFQETCCNGTLYHQPRVVQGSMIRTYRGSDSSDAEIRSFDLNQKTDQSLKKWIGVKSENPYKSIRISLSNLYLEHSSRIYVLKNQYISHKDQDVRLYELDMGGNILSSTDELPESFLAASIIFADPHSIFVLSGDRQVTVFKKR